MDRIPEPPTLVLDPNDENIILGIPEDRSPEKEQEEPSTKKEKVRSSSVWLDPLHLVWVLFRLVRSSSVWFGPLLFYNCLTDAMFDYCSYSSHIVCHV